VVPEYAGVCCRQFRSLVVVKGWYMYCMGLVACDPSTWGNGSPGTWHRGHSVIAKVPASLLVSLPEFGDLPQWLVSFSEAINGKGGYKEGPIG
jgi:hypothetical protein